MYISADKNIGDFMNKKTLVILITIISIICSSFVVSLADSGWDYDYDSGWDSYDSDWDSYDSGWDSYDSGWDSYDSDWDSDSSGGSTDISGLIILVILLFFGIKLAIEDHNRKRRFDLITNNSSAAKYNNKVKTKNKSKIREISYEKLTQYPEVYRGNFLEQVYDNYVEIQKAWSEFDYTKLSKLTTNELFNTYKMQLETLALKKQKNVMSDFNKHYLVIRDINELNGILTVDVVLGVTQKDYVIDETTKKVKRGNANAICDVFYQLTFVRNKESDKDILECPNCSAKINDANLYRCEYCNSILVGISNEKWLLAKKEVISQHKF